MSYQNSLKALRAKMLEQATGRAAPEQKGLEAFVPARASQMPEETPDDLMSKGANWVSEIKKASMEFKKAYEELRSKGSTPSAGEGFAVAFQQGLSRSSKEEEPTVPTPKEAFIQRRSENSPSTYAPRRPNEVASFKDAIDLTEGGGSYDTLFSFSERDGGRFAGQKVSQMTIGEIKNFASPNGEYGQWVKDKVGRVATPMGRYQFVGTTLKALANEMGLDDNTVFSPEVQDQMFEHYLQKQIASGKTLDEKVAQVRGAWEGFKAIPTATLESLIQKYEAA